MINTHHINLKSTPFELIKSGKKHAEIRLYDGKWQSITLGDQLVFQHEENEPIIKEVIGLHKFESFEHMFSFYTDPQKIFGDTKENIMQRLYTYYTREEEHKGVIIVHFA